MISHNAVAVAAQRGEIAGLLVAEVLVGAVMHLENDGLATAVAQTAPEARGFKFSPPDGGGRATRGCGCIRGRASFGLTVGVFV